MLKRAMKKLTPKQRHCPELGLLTRPLMRGDRRRIMECRFNTVRRMFRATPETGATGEDNSVER